MKVRSDFVTNSSSSSFVIAYRELPRFDEETIKKYPILSTFQSMIDSVLSSSGNETAPAEVFCSLDEWRDHLVDSFGYKGDDIENVILEDQYCKKLWDSTRLLFEKGYKIAEKSIGYDDNSVSEILLAMAKNNENFLIIDEE